LVIFLILDYKGIFQPYLSEDKDILKHPYTIYKENVCSELYGAKDKLKKLEDFVIFKMTYFHLSSQRYVYFSKEIEAL